MNDLNFSFIGWCHEDGKDGKKHDKVWAAFNVGPAYYAAWGKRGKALSFKFYGTDNSGDRPPKAYLEQSTMIRKKKKDYKAVDEFELFTIFPHFKDEIVEQLVTSVLSDKVM